MDATDVLVENLREALRRVQWSITVGLIASLSLVLLQYSAEADFTTLPGTAVPVDPITAKILLAAAHIVAGFLAIGSLDEAARIAGKIKDPEIRNAALHYPSFATSPGMAVRIPACLLPPILFLIAIVWWGMTGFDVEDGRGFIVAAFIFGAMPYAFVAYLTKKLIPSHTAPADGDEPDTESLRNDLKRLLRFQPVRDGVPFQILDERHEDAYSRLLIHYAGDEEDSIPAYLLIPDGPGPFPAVLILHQHNGEWHLGKSEVCGLAGDPWQAFGPALARAGFVVLAPDAVCFEDRRRNQPGTAPADDPEAGWLQHYNEMAYRLLRGDLLMRNVLADTATAFSLLQHHSKVDSRRIGVLGHSYGGNTALFYAALEPEVQFACSSGAACSYRAKMAEGTGVEMAEVIPGFVERHDIGDLVTCIAPRRLLIVSASEDPYSRDAGAIAASAREAYARDEAGERLEHKAYEGGHALTEDRFDYIVQWVAAQRAAPPSRT